MFAQLSMYDWPELSSQTDKLWQSIYSVFVQHGMETPQNLDRETPSEIVWSSGECFFSQTCGWPYIRHYREKLALIGAPVYKVDGCQGILNSSRIIARRSDPRNRLEEFHGARIAINGLDSQSGFQAMKSTLTEVQCTAPFFTEQTVSGSHRQTAKDVVAGKADVGCIDPVSWNLISRFEKTIYDDLKVIGFGPQTPGLPFVTSLQNKRLMTAQPILNDLKELFDNGLEADVKHDLRLDGVEFPSISDYEYLITLDRNATEAGHNQLSKNQSAES